MTREEIIKVYGRMIEFTVYQGMRLYLAGDEPKKFITPNMLIPDLPDEVKRATCQIYNDVMSKVVHRAEMAKDELYVQQGGGHRPFSREMTLEEMREKIELPKGVFPDAIRGR